MADFYVGINRGETENPGNVSNGTTTAGDDIELRMDSGKNLTRKDVLLAIEAFEQYILGNWVPGQLGATKFLPPL